LLSGRRLWAAVAGLSLDQLVAWGVLYYAYTVLSVPIAADLGVSRLHVAAAFSVCLLVAGWMGRHVGAVLDARGTRGSLRLGALLAPLVFAALALVADMASLVVAFALLGVVQALALYEPAFRTIVDWCPEERARSRAMLGLTIVGGFASTVFLPLTGWLLTQRSWRETVLVLAAGLAVVLVPTRFLLPLSSRGGPRAAVARLHAPPSARRLAVGLALHSLASTGVFVYLMWHLMEQGASLGAAAGLAGLAGGAQGLGRLVSGPLRRAAGGGHFLPLLLLAQAVALLGVVALEGGAMTACVILFGAVSGVMTLERATVLIEWYGRATFGAHQGRLAAATSTARAVSPFLVEGGHVIASYAVVFGVLAGVLMLSAWVCQSAARLHHQEPLPGEWVLSR
jgi:MFS family permease